MSDDFARPLPPGPGCPNHPGAAATIGCERCGTLVCATCVADCPGNEPVCPACVASHGFSALRREGAVLDPIECLQRVWELFKARWTVVVLAALIVFGIQMVASAPLQVVNFAFGHTADWPAVRTVLAVLVVPLFVATYYVTFSLQLGIIIVWLRLLRGQPVEPTHVFQGFRYGHLALVSVFLMIIAVALGMLALLIGAVIVFVGLSLYGPLLVDKGMGPIQALQGSWEITRGHRWPLFVVLVLAIPILMLGCLACCVGMLPAQGIIAGLQVAAYCTLTWPGNHYLRE